MINIMDRSNAPISTQTMASARQNYERLRDLYQDAAVSARRLQEARSRWQAEKARMKADRRHIREIRGFVPGEVVVATDAQMLPFVEFRWQIPNEDDD